MAEVRVTISGLTGSGKSAIYMEIVAALRAIGVPVSHADPQAFQMLLNGGEGDSETGLQMYQPTVIMEERNIPRAAASVRP
jgi:adenylylsulfate kinase-like enzyme